MAQEGTSERACDRCRERRVKCDKRQPCCLRCEKLGKPCPGYDKKRKFVDEGVSLRKKYQTAHSRNGSLEESYQDGDTSSTIGGSTIDRGFTSPHVKFESPSDPLAHRTSTPEPFYPHLSDQGHATATHIIPSSSDLPNTAPGLLTDPLLYLGGNAQAGADSFVDFFNDPGLDPAWFDIEPDVFFGPLGHSCGFISAAPNIVDDVDREDVMQSTETSDATPMSFGGLSESNPFVKEQIHTSAIITDEREHEMAYLIRHFTEAIGPWMDLFDQEKHFSNLVPLKALRDALLRNAIAAVAAKQLGRVKGTKSYVSRQCQKPATMEVIHDVPVTDWYYKAANYYDKAIAFSRVYLQAISGSLSNPPSPNLQLTASLANSDDLLVAVSIFSLYESLDNLDVSWLQHLAGFKSLLSTSTSDPTSQSEASQPTLTVGRRASFWNFARADYQAAYINHQHTFLNTDDMLLWNNSGLQLQADGGLYTDPTATKISPTPCHATVEIVSHTLLYLLLRVMNYLASDTEEVPTHRQSRWLQLTRQLDEWHNHLPETFQPCAQMRYPLRTSSTRLMEEFFTMPVCAATLQLYHSARILLSLHKPIHPTQPHTNDFSVDPSLQSLLASSAEALKHAHRIVGIALGRPPPAVRVEMLLPLYIAGICLEDDEERTVLLELLRAIEMDTGYETEGRCQDLMRRWEWPNMLDVGRIAL